MKWKRRSEGKQSGLKRTAFLCMMISILVFAGCKRQETNQGLPKDVKTAPEESSQAGPDQSEEEQAYLQTEERAGSQEESEQKTEAAEAEDKTEMKMFINGTEVKVAWEDNESVDALKELAVKGLEITMSMYGGFEQVGQIGQDLPANDEQITTEAGDIVLYSGDQMVVFYGSNSWDYTKLGHITDKTAEELEELLGNGDAVITINMKKEEDD